METLTEIFEDNRKRNLRMIECYEEAVRVVRAAQAERVVLMDGCLTVGSGLTTGWYWVRHTVSSRLTNKWGKMGAGEAVQVVANILFLYEVTAGAAEAAT